jgi:hypothetical protein
MAQVLTNSKKNEATFRLDLMPLMTEHYLCQLLHSFLKHRPPRIFTHQTVFTILITWTPQKPLQALRLCLKQSLVILQTRSQFSTLPFIKRLLLICLWE